jgi:hypothetical protein
MSITLSGPRALGCAFVALALTSAPAAVGATATSPQSAIPAGAVVLDQFADGTRPQDERIATYAGWLAWSHRDPATGDYQLTVRTPAGQTAPAGVAERGLPFDVEIGPTSTGGVAAVYSRCTDVTTNSGCRIVELPLGAAAPTETTLRPPGGGSLHSPAVYGKRLAFLRTVAGGGTRHPDELFEWTAGAPRLDAFGLPRNTYTAAQLKNDPSLAKTQGATGQITSLSLTGTRVAYTRVAAVVDPITTSDAWVQSPHAAPQLVDRFNTGGAATGLRTYLSPTIADGSLYTFRQYADVGNSLVRYGLTTHTAAQAQLKFSTKEEYRVDSAVRDGSGVAWSITDGLAESGTTLVLFNPSVTWQPIARPRPAHLPAY